MITDQNRMAARLFRWSPIFPEFLSWWLQELSASIPGALRRALRLRPDPVVVDIGEHQAVVTHWKGAARSELARLDLARGAPAGAIETVAPRLRTVGRKATVVARLPAEKVLRKTIGLPLTADEDLRRLLAFELDRQIPLKAEEVYFGFKVQERSRERRRMRVELVVAPRAAVDGAVQLLETIGLFPDAVDIADNDTDEIPYVNLLPISDAPDRSRAFRSATSAFGGLFALLLVAAICLPLLRHRSAAETLGAQLAAARAQADIVLKMQRDLEHLRLNGLVLAERKRQVRPTVEVLAEVTRLLPDDTWLMQFQLNGNELQIFGYSASASGLIGRIEDSPLFQDTMFRSPIVLDPATSRERFHLATQLAPNAER